MSRLHILSPFPADVEVEFGGPKTSSSAKACLGIVILARIVSPVCMLASAEVADEEAVSVTDAYIVLNTVDVDAADGTVVEGVALPVTVTKIKLVTVLVLTARVDDEGVARAEADCVTVAVLTTVATDTETETEGGCDRREDAVPVLCVCEEPVDEIDEADEEEVGAGTAALNGTGVGTTVELGLGGGMPFGYEFSKMSS